MKSLAAAALLLAAGQAGAATLVVDFFNTPNADEGPFKTIRCNGPSCAGDGLMPLDGVMSPVILAVESDPAGDLRVQVDRGGLNRYELQPINAKTLKLGDIRHQAWIVQLHGKEARRGLLDDDLVVRKDTQQGLVWVKARIER